MKKKFYILLAAMMLSSIGSFAQIEEADDAIHLNQYGQVVESVDLEAEARNAIITFESNDGNYKFWMDNRVLFDGAYFFDKTPITE